MSTSGSEQDVAILGGGDREREIARSFIDSGARVRIYGTVDMSDLGLSPAESVETAISGATVVVCPMPGLGVDGSLFAPHAPVPITFTPELLAMTADGAKIFLGRDTAALREMAVAASVEICEMGGDDVLQVQHAIPTAEAAIAVAISNTDEVLVNSAIGIVGYGRIGQLLAAYLSGFGVRATVAARRPESRVRAAALGHPSLPTDADSLKQLLADSDIVFLTASAQLVDREVATGARDGLLVIDLVSPPGGCDHDAVRERGARVIWARAQADSAAMHSARAQYRHIVGRL